MQQNFVALALFFRTVTIISVTVTERLSIRQVAQRAGVSRTTVSRALNNHPEISQGTRQRVLEVVRELEYMPVAQPMVHNRHIETGVIGLVFDGAPMESAWGMPTFWGMREAAIEYDYDLLTLLKVRPDWMMDQEELQFLDRRTDGIIFITPQDRYQTLEALGKHRLPVAACFTTDVPDEVPVVTVDNGDAMRQTVQHLVANGHERILHLSPQTQRSDFVQRRQGFDETMNAAGLEPIALCVENLVDAKNTNRFLTALRQHRITAVACASDSLAYCAWDIADAEGMKIPQDFSLTGMDNVAPPPGRGLTSIDYSCEDVGKRALEIVAEIIQTGECSQSDVLPVKLVDRTSVANPPY